MSQTTEYELDVVIFGGGASGLWLLDDMLRRGYSAVLIESRALGSGQTIGAQGILHGGFKYSLGGMVTPSARQVRDMPSHWRRCLAGDALPDLSNVVKRADVCHLWTTRSLTSCLAAFAASMALNVKPVKLKAGDVPPALAGCRGSVYRLDEQVIKPESLLATLAGLHERHLLLVDTELQLDFDIRAPGKVDAIALTGCKSTLTVLLRPRFVVFTAGAGSAGLRKQVGLPESAMQRRPVQMIVARGNLPQINGHCIDGAATRVTITSDIEDGETWWQIGGSVSEAGVSMSAVELIRFARQEILDVIPGIDLTGVEWTTYSVDKAEVATRGGVRPDDAAVHREGNVISAWPTKLVLVPRLVEAVCAQLPPPSVRDTEVDEQIEWPRPPVAVPPWKETDAWNTEI